MSARDLSIGLQHLRNGEWAPAHEIAQADDSQQGAWLHGIVHMIERDESNARYWFARADRKFPGMSEQDIADEMDALAKAIEA